MPRVPRLPCGTDRRAKSPEAAWPFEPTQIEAAHAASELVDDDQPEDSMRFARGLVLAIAVTAFGVVIGSALASFFRT